MMIFGVTFCLSALADFWRHSKPIIFRVIHTILKFSISLYSFCSYRVRGVEGSCANHLTIEFYTVVMLLANIYIYYC